MSPDRPLGTRGTCNESGVVLRSEHWSEFGNRYHRVGGSTGLLLTENGRNVRSFRDGLLSKLTGCAVS